MTQLTLQAKKAAEEASKSVQEASKSALEASKTATAVSKNTFEDLTYVGKSTFGDLTKSAKEVATKKGLLKVIFLSCNYFSSMDLNLLVALKLSLKCWELCFL